MTDYDDYPNDAVMNVIASIKLIDAQLSFARKRVDQYYNLVTDIEKLVQNSDSKVSKQIKQLIDDHYKL